ncbi:nuclear transport factor 2 family protein [Haloplanus ruber]|uniref:Nuclear transport factor 2 family protein n=1 Tax=Haloplanus ruber TaxID=869892 RepID=A0ABD6D372_9EURY|nr:nuclear transport factor 2 family protein [Haloplanus ruber]
MTTTEDVLDHHLDAFTAQDLDETLVDYTDDSVVITNMGTFRGLDEIEGLFADLFAEFSQDGSRIDLEQKTVEGEYGYIVWDGETPDNDYEFCTDTFVVQDGTIHRQTFAGKIEPNA